jgi:hypothetical protein
MENCFEAGSEVSAITVQVFELLVWFEMDSKIEGAIIMPI